MTETPEAYHVTTNDCRHYALRLVDKILKNGRERKYLTADGFHLEAFKPQVITPDQDAVLVGKIQPVIVAIEVQAEPELVEVAVSDDPEALRQALVKVVEIMIDNTPRLILGELQKMVSR